MFFDLDAEWLPQVQRNNAIESDCRDYAIVSVRGLRSENVSAFLR
jgi:hypothetical protein